MKSIASLSSATFTKAGNLSNDHRRFDLIVVPHLADAHALARWLSGSDADAHDIIQDTCIRALRSIGGFANGNARSWVLAIVRNTACDWIRKNRPAALVYVDRLEEIEAVPLADQARATPEAALIAAEEESELDAAIAALKQPFRETLVLRDVQGFTYRDIAERCGVSTGTVMSRLFRARRQLTRMLVQSDQRCIHRDAVTIMPGISQRRTESSLLYDDNGEFDATWSEPHRLSA